MPKEELLLPIPILIDGEPTVSNGLDLFQTEWGSKVDQNALTQRIGGCVHDDHIYGSKISGRMRTRSYNLIDRILLGVYTPNVGE